MSSMGPARERTLTRDQKLEAKRVGVEWARTRRLNSPDDGGIFDAKWVYCGDLPEDVRAEYASLVAAAATHAWRKR